MYSRQEIILVVLINIRNESVLRIKRKKSEKRILTKHSINFNIVKKKEKKGKYLKYTEKRCISKCLRSFKIIYFCFLLVSIPWCTYCVDGTWAVLILLLNCIFILC